MKLQLNHFIHAAHQLPDSEDLVTKECARLHGHTYLVKVEIESPALDNKRSGMIVDFKAIKNIINILDHRFINDVFKEYNFNEPTTAENIAKFIKMKIGGDLSFYFSDITVGVCEGYKGEESSCWVWT